MTLSIHQYLNNNKNNINNNNNNNEYICKA